MKRALVIGGRGYLGQQVVQGLEATPGWRAVASSRQDGGPDLRDATTFGALDGYDVIVNCSDSTRAAPDALAAWCLDQGMRLIETTSEPETVRRLLRELRGVRGDGLVVLGGGIFTGLSNVLAGEAARSTQGCRRLSLGVRFSPLARGGAGMVELGVAFMASPTATYRDGAEILGPSIAPGPELPFPSGPQRTLSLPFAEPSMLFASTRVPEIGAFMGPSPAILGPAFRMIPAAWGRQRWFQGVFRAYLSLVRRALLRWRTSSVELVAVAEGDAGARRVLSASVDDGMLAAGYLAAAKVATLPEGRSGVLTPDELWAPEPLVAASNERAPDRAQVALRRE